MVRPAGFEPGFVEGNGTTLDTVGQRRAFDEFKDQRLGIARVFQTVYRGDIRMVQAGKNLCFPLEPRQPIRIVGKRFGQDLQRDLAVELRVGGLLHLAHSALADEGRHVVMAESGADLKGAMMCDVL